VGRTSGGVAQLVERLHGMQEVREFDSPRLHQKAQFRSGAAASGVEPPGRKSRRDHMMAAAKLRSWPSVGPFGQVRRRLWQRLAEDDAGRRRSTSPQESEFPVGRRAERPP
jgi:hypothetical protein